MTSSFRLGICCEAPPACFSFSACSLYARDSTNHELREARQGPLKRSREKGKAHVHHPMLSIIIVARAHARDRGSAARRRRGAGTTAATATAACETPAAESRFAAAAHHHAGAGENDHRGFHPVCRRAVLRVQRECAECEEEEKKALRRKCASHAAERAAHAPAAVDRVVAGPGRPLEPALRQDMESRFRTRLFNGAGAFGRRR